MSDETVCKFVGSRGLLKSCDIRSLTPLSSVHHVINQDLGICSFQTNDDETSVTDACTIYICSSALADFVNNWLDNIKRRFILLSGDSDAQIPIQALTSDEFEKLYNNRFLVAWFSQNLVYSPKIYSKLNYLPIGLDYHTMSERLTFWGPITNPKLQEDLLIAIASRSKPFYERQPTAYTTFHFEIKRGSRMTAYNEIPQELVYYEPEPTTRLSSWIKQIKYAFVVSPPGEGLDCHRTWEALCLGCIPIMISTPLDDMFEGLPVLIVKSWKDVTAELLCKTVEEFKTREFKMERLTLDYWMLQINAHR